MREQIKGSPMPIEQGNCAPNGDERRFWKRLTAKDSIVTIVGEHASYEATVVDKSFGGLALTLATHDGPQEDEVITIQVANDAIQARVRRIETLANGGCRIACEWLAEADAFGKIFSQLVQPDA
jgi:hypothetical protein